MSIILDFDQLTFATQAGKPLAKENSQYDSPCHSVLFQLARVMGIVRIKNKFAVKELYVHDESLKIWQSLSDSSKELSLLKFLISGLNPEFISEGKISDSIFQHCLVIAQKFAQSTDYKNSCSQALVDLLAGFQFLDLDTSSITDRGLRIIESLEKKTEVKLENLANCFLNEEELFLTYLEKQLQASDGKLFKRLEADQHEGSFQFSVSLKDHDASTEFIISADSTFEDFVNSILDIYYFEDRLPIYTLEFDNEFGELQKVSHYYAIFRDEEFDSRHVKLKDFSLSQGQDISFHFDFNKNWFFDIKVEKLLSESTTEVQILSKPANPPEQCDDEIIF